MNVNLSEKEVDIIRQSLQKYIASEKANDYNNFSIAFHLFHRLRNDKR